MPKKKENREEDTIESDQNKPVAEYTDNKALSERAEGYKRTYLWQ